MSSNHQQKTGLFKSILTASLAASVFVSIAHAQPVVHDMGIADETGYQAFKSAMYKLEYMRTDYTRNQNPRAVASVTALMVFATNNPHATSQELEEYLSSYSSALAGYTLGDPDLIRSSSFFPAIRYLDRGAPSFVHTGLDLRVSNRVLEVLDVEIPVPLDFQSTRERMVDFENARLRSFANSPDWSLILMLGLYGQDLDGNTNANISDVIGNYLIAEGFEIIPDGVNDARFSLTTSALAQMPSGYSEYSSLLAEVNANPTNLDSTALQDNIQASYTQIQTRNSLLIDQITSVMSNNPPSLIEAAENAMDPNFLAQQEAAYEQDLLAVSDERVTLNWNSMMILQSNQQEAQQYAAWSRDFSHIQLETDDTLAKVKLGIQVASGLAQFGIAVASGDPGAAVGALTDYVLASLDLADAFGAFNSPPPPEEQIFNQIVELRQDVEDMRVQMHDRFDRVEQQLDLIYVSMMTSFNLIGDQIGDLQDDVNDIGRSMAVQRATLDRIEDALYGMVGDVMWNDLIQKVDLVLNYRSEFGTDLAYDGSTSFINSASALKSWTVSSAANTTYAGPINSSLTFQNATQILGGSSIGRNVNDLRVFPATIGLPILFGDRVVASAPWTQAASVYSQLASESPWYFAYMYENQTQGPGNPDLDSIIDKGDDLLAMMENGRDAALFDELFDGYESSVNALSTREGQIIDSVSPVGVNAFGGLTQPDAQLSAPTFRRFDDSHTLYFDETAADWNIFQTSNGEKDIAALSQRLVSHIVATQYPGETPALFYQWNMNSLGENEAFMNFGFTIDGNNGNPGRGLRVQTNRQLRIKVYDNILGNPVSFTSGYDAEDFFVKNFGVWRDFRDNHLLSGQNLAGQTLVIHSSPFGGNTLIEVIGDYALSGPAFPHINGRAKTLEFLEDLQVEAWQSAQNDPAIGIYADQLHDWAALIEAYATLSLPDLIAESTVASSALRGSSGENSFALAVDVAARYGINANDPANAIMIYDRLLPNMTKTIDSFALWLDKPFPGHGYINYMMAELNELRDFAFDLAIDDRYETDGDLVITPENGLLANDVDQQYRTIVVENFTQPDIGSVVVNPDGSFEYMRNEGAQRTTSFTYTTRAQITDINGQAQYFVSNLATVVLFVDGEIITYVPGDVPTINEAVALIYDDPNSVIELAPGIYREHINTLGKAFTLRSASGDPTDTIISGDLDGDGIGDGRVVTITSGEGRDTVIQGVTIRDGQTNSSGAGMWISNAAPSIIGCVFTNNHTDLSGGAIYLGSGRALIVNCLFYQNSSFLWGGGIDNTLSSGSNPIVIGCTFTQNAADLGNDDETGGGFRLKGGGTVVYNCILAGNSPDQVELGGAGVVIANSLVRGGIENFVNGGGNINASPQFVDPSSGDFRLDAGSPVIDAGHNTPHSAFVGFLTDLDGNARFFDDLDTPDTGIGSSPIIDMGAYEYQGAEPCPADFTGDGIINFFDVSAFLQLFGAQDPEADFTDDGIWNFFDVSSFLQAFAAGCP